ncbi:HK97 family phage prohead protease [Deinococcus humi]|uniref:HK97 family phage prohead protease n=1 Tax=Deinococcus humi TaxID=662880 RepID=A0A7W8JQM3_9DEIO|nr:HK97 family phage prohead protease [Deinococcus humi]MBB5361339.1 HK97 family phage prohead protease [Deinococcus humi]GGO19539.1 hypothetical protein GCM10008949_04030 [Deinococcus humi]
MTNRTTDPSLKPGQYLVAQVRTVQDATDGAVKIAGVANDSSVTDSFGTRIKFSQRALDGFKTNPVLLFNHDTDNPIGTVTSVEYRGSQLWAEAEIHPDARTPAGASITALVRSGVLRAFSVRFDEYKQERAADHISIQADAMDELSVVTLPSNKPSLFQARAKGVKLHGAEEIITAEEVGRALDARSDETRAAGVLEHQTLSSRLYAAINEMSDWRCQLIAIYDDFCVYVDYESRRYFRKEYSVDESGNVSLGGEAVEVLPQWQAVGEVATERQADSVMFRLSEADIQAVSARVVAELDAKEARTARNVPEPPAIVPMPAETPPEQPAEVGPTLDDVRQALRSVAQTSPRPPAG